MLALYTILLYSNQAKWPHRLTVRTNPSQGLNRSSILRGVTKSKETIFKTLKTIFAFILKRIMGNSQF
jgi:hypothetical protein